MNLINRYKQWQIPVWMKVLAWFLVCVSFALTVVNVYGFHYPNIRTTANPIMEYSIFAIRYLVFLYCLLVRRWVGAALSFIIAVMGDAIVIFTPMLIAYCFYGILPNS